MKKIIMMVLVLCMGFGVTGCSGKEVFGMKILDTKEYKFDDVDNITIITEEREEFKIVSLEESLVTVIKKYDVPKKYNNIRIYIVKNGTSKTEYTNNEYIASNAINSIDIQYKQSTDSIVWNIQDRCTNEILGAGEIKIKDIKNK